MTKTNAQKGVWAEQIAKAHFSTKKNCIVFEPIGGIGLCDLMVLNTATGEITKYDVKYGGQRFLFNRGNKNGNGGLRLIHRVPSEKQKKLNIKLIYVMADGTIGKPKSETRVRDKGNNAK